MFPAATKNSIIAASVQAFDMLSTPAVLTHVASGATVNLGVGIKTAGPQDTAIVNAWGVDARVITMKVADVAGFTPDKFDYITLGGERMVFAAVHVHRVNDVSLFYKGYVKGHAP